MHLRHFFKENVTGFTYLFFAQAIFIAENIFWRHQFANPSGNIMFQSFSAGFILFTIVFYYSFPLIFALAAFSTFNYPKNKNAQFLFIYITVLICLMFVASALLN